jgi:selenocysteine lyase/cysteine desulfurase
MSRSPVTPEYDLATLRSRIPILRHAIPMNNCSQAPLSEPVRAAAAEFLESWNSRGMDWDRWMHEVELAKRQFAALINAAPDEVAAVASVSHATSVIASALDFPPDRDVIVTTAAEFPTVGHVWLAHERAGAKVRWVPLRNGALDLDDYEQAVDERTRVVSATLAFYLDGFRQDAVALARIAHARGALVYLDAYQALGTAPVDVKAIDVDFLASGTLKFLMGTPGIAFLYAKRELIEGLRPAITGWFGRADPYAFDVTRLDWHATASRLEAGTPSIFGAFVSRAGMAMLTEIGLPSIGRWTAQLSRRLVEGGVARGLTIHGPGLARDKTATTAFVCSNSSDVEVRLRERGVLASARGGVIRLAPHFYSSLDDVDSALDALAAEQGPRPSRPTVEH